jgi:hypothetical protein
MTATSWRKSLVRGDQLSSFISCLIVRRPAEDRLIYAPAPSRAVVGVLPSAGFSFQRLSVDFPDQLIEHSGAPPPGCFSRSHGPGPFAHRKVRF